MEHAERTFKLLNQTGSGSTAKEVIQLKKYGVDVSYVREWRDAGYNFNSEELIKLRQSGVPAEYASALIVERRKPLSASTIIDLRRRGVSPELARKIRR